MTPSSASRWKTSLWASRTPNTDAPKITPASNSPRTADWPILRETTQYFCCCEQKNQEPEKLWNFKMLHVHCSFLPLTFLGVGHVAAEAVAPSLFLVLRTLLW